MEWVPSAQTLRVAVAATCVFAAGLAGQPSAAFDTAGAKLTTFPFAQRPLSAEITGSFADAGWSDNLADRIIAAEGGPEPNPWSSAAGYGQFLSGTWLEIFRRAYPQIAQIMSREQILALREVKPLAEDLTNRYAKANALFLQRVGLPATDTALSLAHAVGPGGAINILTSAPARPAADLLSPEAIAANPLFKGMTANALQRWAMNRIAPAAAPQPIEEPTPRREDALDPLDPAEDFRLDGHTAASEVLITNQHATALLQEVLQAEPKPAARTGIALGSSKASWLKSAGVDRTALLRADQTAGRLFNKDATRLVLDTIRQVSSRPAYREFKAIENNADRQGGLPPAVIREVAMALVETMRRESATIIDIVRHRRNSGAGKPIAGNYTSRAFRDVSNPRGAIASDLAR
jgi:hypothetical protein